jgi:hypothetical protein
MKAHAESANCAMLLATAYMPLIANSMSHRQPSKVMPMLDEQLPPSDLEKLARDVLGQHPSAALPCNLSDEWLSLIARDLDTCMGEISPDDDGEPSDHMAAPLALVIHLLQGKANGQEELIAFDDFERYLNDYKIEIQLELVNRKTNVSIQPACLLNIFEGREVRVEIAREIPMPHARPNGADNWDSFLRLIDKNDAELDLENTRDGGRARQDPFEGWQDGGCNVKNGDGV